MIAIFIILPLITLIKVSSVEKKLTKLEESINRMNKSPGEHIPSPAPSPAVEVAIPVELPEEEPEPEPEEEIVPPVETAPEIPVFTTFGKREEKKVPKKKTQSIKFENLLSKIGIVTLVLGVGFFVKYAIDKEWINEIGRVAIGLLAGGILIAIAHKLREKYNLFSAIMVGGGISVLYITITLAFREYQLFDQTVAFGILIAITIFSVILSLLYNRKELALFSLLGGYASPLMISTGEGNYIVLFSFLLILNSGMLIISMRKRWNVIGIVSFFCTQLFYWVWLLLQFDAQYTGALLFAVLFFVQFYLLALFAHFLAGRKISPFQAIIILTNNISLFAASIYIFHDTELRIQGVITIAMAAINAIVMLLLFKRASIDKRLLYLIIAIVLSFVSLAIPVQLNGHVITMFWAAEMVILLWLWRTSGIKVFQAGFLLITVLTLISYLMDAAYNYRYDAELAILLNRIFITGVVVVASLIVCRYLLSKENGERKGIIKTSVISRALNIAVILTAYLVPLLEINFQLSESYAEQAGGFRLMNLSSYTILYIAAVAFIYRRKLSAPWLYVLTGVIAAYTLVSLPVMAATRKNIFFSDLSTGLFLWHYLALPALAYIIYLLAGRVKTLPRQIFIALGWILVGLSVVILSVELDNTVIQLAGAAGDYHDLLYDTHTFGYPILWGVLAMALMFWGLRNKEVLLRQISLAFFAFIILKFYISDIWMMSQTGRIISFVALGIILLTASFLIQKIKVLIKEDKEEDDETTDKE